MDVKLCLLGVALGITRAARREIKMIYLTYDPPSGWKYGFPKRYNPQDPDEPIADTLLRDGYPQEEIDRHGPDVPCWMTEHELQEDQQSPD